MQLDPNMIRYSIILHEKDNVATVLDDEEDKKLLEDGTLLKGNIPIGHKIALCDIVMGEPVIKYGVKIGLATSDISRGEHVHIHNCI